MAFASSSEPRRRPSRRGPVWRAFWLVLTLLSAFAVSAQGAEPEKVRTGTTSVENPTENAARERAKKDAQLPPHTPPGDAPHVHGRELKLPSAPASFNTYDGGWIQFAYPPSIRERVQPLIARADSIRNELGERLGQVVLRKVHVRVARTPGEMATLAPESAPFPKYAAGVAYSQIGLVLLTLQPVHPNSQHELDEVFAHELAHVALYDALEGHPVPRWFNEGFAVFASGEGSISRLQTLWTATLADTLLPLRQLENSFPRNEVDAGIAYAEAADIVRYLVRQQERERFNALIQRVRDGQPFERALEVAYNTDVANLEYEWREDVAKRYTFWPVFFSGSFVWAAAIGLFAWGWRRKRRRTKATLERWAQEEAAEDAQRRELLKRESAARMHIVLARARKDSSDLKGMVPEAEVPKVQHEGEWHTLH